MVTSIVTNDKNTDTQIKYRYLNRGLRLNMNIYYFVAVVKWLNL